MDILLRCSVVVGWGDGIEGVVLEDEVALEGLKLRELISRRHCNAVSGARRIGGIISPPPLTQAKLAEPNAPGC